MPGKWKVLVVSQKRFAKARSNWRSLYSCVSWFDKASKKVPKLASLMMFLMLRDNDAHSLFNIWRLPWLLRLYNIKVQAYQFPWPKPTCPKLPCTQKSYVPHQKINAPPKCHHYQILPQPNFLTCPYTTTKFFHSHAKRKNSYMTKIKFPTSSCTNKFSHNQNHNHTIFQESTSHTQQNFSISQSFIPTKFANTHKYIYAHTHKILPCP